VNVHRHRIPWGYLLRVKDIVANHEIISLLQSWE
jgi:hypothetical protein